MIRAYFLAASLDKSSLSGVGEEGGGGRRGGIERGELGDEMN